MSTTEKTMTEKEAIAIVTKNGYDLKIIPYNLRTPAVVKAALNESQSELVARNVPKEQRTLKMLLDCVSTYGSTQDVRSFAEDCIDSSWGISVSGFVALVKKGTVPTMKNVSEENKELVYKFAFNKDASVILDMPTDLIEKIVSAEHISKIFHATKGEHDRWIGDAAIALVPKAILEDTADEIEKFILNALDNNRKSVNISNFPKEVITHAICMKSATIRGYLNEIPVEFRTQDICKLAVMKNGSSIKYVPAEFKKDFYLDAAMTGRGLSSIPEEDITDRICAIAVDKNADEFRYVPVDKRSYTLSMIAVDKKAENFEFVNDENIDDEMVIRFIIAVLKKNYESEYALRDGRYSENGKTSPLDKAFSHIVKEGMRHTEMMEAKENIMLEVLRREPSVFTEFVKQSSERGFKQFEGLLNMALCMVAVKGDKKNVSSIPHLFHERVWVEYVQNHLK
jgi:hypothetical protein